DNLVERDGRAGLEPLQRRLVGAAVGAGQVVGVPPAHRHTLARAHLPGAHRVGVRGEVNDLDGGGDRGGTVGVVADALGDEGDVARVGLEVGEDRLGVLELVGGGGRGAGGGDEGRGEQ